MDKEAEIDLMDEKCAPMYNGVLHYRNLSLDDIPGEGWVDIVGYDGSYRVSDFGRVKSVGRYRDCRGRKMRVKERILAQPILSTGYPKVELSKKSEKTPFTIHTLVGRHFLDNPLSLPEINHKKGCKTDNRKSVLEWSTQYDNIAHAKETGLDPNSGETHPLAKFSNEEVVKIFLSKKKCKELSDLYGVTLQCIWNIKNKKTWARVTKGV